MVLDILIMNGIVFTMEGPGVGAILDGAVGIKGNSIVAVGESKEILRHYSAHRYIDARNKAVLPGLINAHLHSADGIARGAAQDMTDWLYRGIMPILNCADVATMNLGSMVSIVEAVKTGTTTMCDFSYNSLSVVQNHIKIGSRVVMSEIIYELPEKFTKQAPEDPLEVYEFDHAVGEKKFNENVQLIEQYHGYEDGRVTCCMSPLSADMVSFELLQESYQYAREKDVGVHIHVAQNPTELAITKKRYGKPTVPLMAEHNMFGPDVLVAHLTFATDEEIQLIADTGSGMVLCPTSVPLVRGYLPRGEQYQKAGGTVALGSDTPATNHNNNMFGEMKFGAIMHKVKHGTATVFPAWQMLRMATIEGARAIKMDHMIGSLKVGKRADIILVDLLNITMAPLIMAPLRNIVPNLVYAANGSEVSTVIIDGKIVVDDYRLLTVDEKSLINDINRAVSGFGNALAANSSVRNMPMVQLTVDGYY